MLRLNILITILKLRLMNNSSMVKVSLLSLGSNLGNRKKNIQNCIHSINICKNIKVVAVSSLYESSPMYNLNQQDYINCVIEIETTLKPLKLLRNNQIIEKNMGRIRSLSRNQPRTIDIDILTYNSEIINEENLRVPHPRIFERKFVLNPLFELKGNIVIPGNDKKIEDLIKELDKKSDKIRQCKYKINEKDLSYSS